MFGVLPPRLLQDHCPTGEPQGIALVQLWNRCGEILVNASEPSHHKIWQRIKHALHSAEHRLIGHSNALQKGSEHRLDTGCAQTWETTG